MTTYIKMNFNIYCGCNINNCFRNYYTKFKTDSATLTCLKKVRHRLSEKYNFNLTGLYIIHI